jgi:hypothetical protein
MAFLETPIDEENYWIGDYTVDLSPWTLTRHDESKYGFYELKNKIKELGFEISEEEEKMWDNYINSRYKEEGE